jgi:hypothetical protein
MKPIVEALGDAVIEVEVDGLRAFARANDLDAIESTKPTRGAVHLLGGFDPLIVGGGLREQLIPPAHLKRVSRTAGWISPVVLVDGVAAGVWDARQAGKVLTVTVEPFGTLTASLRKGIAAAAERVATAQGLSATVGYGRVFPEKRAKFLVNDR